MATGTVTAPVLPPEWQKAISGRRQMLHYKPAALLVMLDMLEAGEAPQGHVPFTRFEPRFTALLKPFDKKGSDLGWRTFYHLSTGDQVWSLYKNGRPAVTPPGRPNKSRSHVLSYADEAVIHGHLLPFVNSPQGRLAVRNALLDILAADGTDQADELVSRYRPIQRVYTSARLVQGQVYTREQLAADFKIADATLKTGIFQPSGTDSIWIFITKEKTKDRTQYSDRLEGDVLYWQGQTEGRKDPIIIEHEQRGLEIVVFYRDKKYEHTGAGFRYEGLFQFVSHSGSKPTNFILHRIYVTETPLETPPDGSQYRYQDIEVAPPSGHAPLIDTSKGAGMARKVDWSRVTEANRKLGAQGEQFIVDMEKRYLKEIGRADLADAVIWVSDTQGDGTGYDIMSFDENGALKYIEVKTTNADRETPFLISLNEIRSSKRHGTNYWLYRVFTFASVPPGLYRLQSPLKSKVSLEPRVYLARCLPAAAM